MGAALTRPLTAYLLLTLGGLTVSAGLGLWLGWPAAVIGAGVEAMAIGGLMLWALVTGGDVEGAKGG